VPQRKAPALPPLRSFQTPQPPTIHRCTARTHLQLQPRGFSPQLSRSEANQTAAERHGAWGVGGEEARARGEEPSSAGPARWPAGSLPNTGRPSPMVPACLSSAARCRPDYFSPQIRCVLCCMPACASHPCGAVRSRLGARPLAHWCQRPILYSIVRFELVRGGWLPSRVVNFRYAVYLPTHRTGMYARTPRRLAPGASPCGSPSFSSRRISAQCTMVPVWPYNWGTGGGGGGRLSHTHAGPTASC
jgi:hypothetical protein